ncbi:head-to-tail stopper [Mycobacterium phage MichelleMyBell]|uniref:Head-to-tail stopper n=1 Tax=Mycobacterium phage MichelleMyBell TaxID=1445726 RepID=W0LK82_9CAUD|nr:head closure [Mycobacterium phage MichelleMyBell]AHG24330.1 head-to-tail stopper [Mycobacterium phage MichelleMyBell]
MTFGGQTVTFVTYENTGPRRPLGGYQQAETLAPVAGCRHRPLSARETAEYDVNVATVVWKTTAPPAPAVLAARQDGEIRVDGVAYKIIAGPQHHVDMDGQPFKVTILSQRQTS